MQAIGQWLQDDLGASQQARLACKHWQHRVFEGWSSSSLVLTAGAQQGPDAARRLSSLARIAPYISHLDVHVSSVQDLAHMAEDTHEREVAHQSNLNEWGGWMRALLQTGEQLELQSMSVLSSSWSHLPGWHEHRLPLSQPDCAPFLPASVEAQVTADHLPSSSGTHQAGTMAFLSSSLHAGSSTGNINERASGSETSSLNRDQSSGNQTSTSGQSYVPVLSHLTYLELLGCILPDRAQPQVAGLPALPARPLTGLWSHLPALVCLLMPDVNVRTADQAQAISTGLPHLQELVVGVHIAALPAVVSELVGIPALLRLELRSFPNWLLPKLAECLEQRHSLACEKHQAAMEVAYWRRRHANSVQNIQGLLGCAQPDTALQRSQALPESKLDGHSPRNDEGCLLLMHSPRKAYGEQGAKRRAYTSQLVPLSSPRQSGRLPMHTVNEVHAGAAYSTNGMPLPAEPLTLGLKLLNSFSPALYAGQGLTAVGVAEPPMPSHATPSGQLFARIAGCTRMCMLELRLPGRAALDAGTIAALASTAHSLRQLRLSVEGPLAASVVAAVASMQVAGAAGLAHVRQACDRQVDELLWDPLTQLLSQLTELETFGLECHLGCLWLTPKATECMQACTAAKVAAAAVPSSTPLGGRASCKLSGTSSGSNGGTAFQRTRVKHLTTLELRVTTGPPHTLASPVLSCKGGTFSPSLSAVPSSPRRCRKYGGHAAVNGAFWAVPSERQTVYAGSSGPLTEMLAALPGLRTLTVDVLPKTWGFLFSLHNTLGCPYTLLLGR